MKNWFSVKALASGAGAEVTIFDDIGAYGVSAQAFIAEIATFHGQPLTVQINSLGGSFFDALAMFNALRMHGAPVTTMAFGVAASAASIVFMAGDVRAMPANTFLMVHDPLTEYAYGDSEELRALADTLDKLAVSMVQIYSSRSGQGEDEIKAMVNADTWLSAKEALDRGFATQIDDALPVTASYDVDRIPEHIRPAFKTEGAEAKHGEPAGGKSNVTADPILVEEITAQANAAGLGDFVTAFALDAEITSAETARAAIAMAREVKALCAVAKLPDRAGEFIQARTSVSDVRKALIEALASADEARQTINVIPTEKQTRGQSGADVWNKIFPPAQKQGA